MLTAERGGMGLCWGLRRWMRGNFGAERSSWLERWKNSRLHLEIRTEWVGFDRCGLVSPTILPYHVSVSEWTAKKAAILGVVFRGPEGLGNGAWRRVWRSVHVLQCGCPSQLFG